MSPSKNNLPLHLRIALPVALVVIGALVLSGAAVMENLRFMHATEQTFRFVDLARSQAAIQKDFAANANEDIFADLQHFGQIVPPTSYVNPWGGQIRATTLSNMLMRFESDVPTHDCRRLALDFIGRNPVGLGLLAIEAQPVVQGGAWSGIYASPQPAGHPGGIVRMACGNAPYARLALIFRMR
ncbi:MAG: hypothetical protein P4M15_10400 [Alphaproteobacteria bacterium]|nr:hypothetical protein [Alphaproteobacteria bacterium]